jgi:uncharacterized protein YqfA (UPF0365 family)
MMMIMNFHICCISEQFCHKKGRKSPHVLQQHTNVLQHPNSIFAQSVRLTVQTATALEIMAAFGIADLEMSSSPWQRLRTDIRNASMEEDPQATNVCTVATKRLR